MYQQLLTNSPGSSIILACMTLSSQVSEKSLIPIPKQIRSQPGVRLKGIKRKYISRSLSYSTYTITLHIYNLNAKQHTLESAYRNKCKNKTINKLGWKKRKKIEHYLHETYCRLLSTILPNPHTMSLQINSDSEFSNLIN